ncbi:hypothetical protein TWF718_005535 [Orbilia javanica]|uniref:Uncharacterized protein n=1 Tax=Orbilia javanica TaxID=47235 RepID=A0AAN8N3R4_9PEZI
MKEWYRNSRLINIEFDRLLCKAPCIGASAQKARGELSVDTSATSNHSRYMYMYMVPLLVNLTSSSLGKSTRLVALSQALICAPWVPKVTAVNLTCVLQVVLLHDTSRTKNSLVELIKYTKP